MRGTEILNLSNVLSLFFIKKYVLHTSADSIIINYIIYDMMLILQSSSPSSDLFTKLHPEDTHAPWDTETLLEDYLEDEEVEAYPDSDSENRSSIASEEDFNNESGSDDSNDFANILASNGNTGSGMLSSSPTGGYFIQHVLSGSSSPRTSLHVHSHESYSASGGSHSDITIDDLDGIHNDVHSDMNIDSHDSHSEEVYEHISTQVEDVDTL
jgi:hypothetical protein